MTDAAAYVCAVCGDRWPRDEHADPLLVARNHPCDGDPDDDDIRFDPGFDADDYEVDFEGVDA